MRLFVPFVVANATAEKYDGFKVLTASWADPLISATVEKILAHSPTIDIWKPERLDLIHDTRSVDFMIAREEVDNVMHLLRLNQVELETMIDDAGVLIEEQRRRPVQMTNTGQYSFTEYLDFPQLSEWIQQLPSQFPSLAKVELKGTTEGDRPIWGLTIGGGDNGKKDIFMECGIHAREWVSSASCRYFINEILNAATDENYPVNEALPYSREELAALATDFNWFIIPASNPDGYSHTHTRNQVLKKITIILSSSCLKLDLK